MSSQNPTPSPDASAQVPEPSSPESFGPSRRWRCPPIPTNPPLLRRILTAFIANEVRKVGVERVVVGLSGGVDSALSCMLAAEALGPNNVLAIKMPYRTSSPESRAHADLVIAKAGVASLEIEITPQIDAYFARFPDADRVRQGNKMARERMSILYDHSARWQALVLGTSNKTELLLGYGTLHGDMASAVNPLGDLYKTQVWALAAHVGVPPEIVHKQPTADLWAGQTDEAELGFGYREVDQLLYCMVDLRYSRAELLAAGFPEAFVRRVSEMVRNSQFKRRLPIIAKVSQRTIDRDFRYARDWGR
jgi:NAD+ synthase